MLKWETGWNVDKFELILLMPLSLYISFLLIDSSILKLVPFFFVEGLQIDRLY